MANQGNRSYFFQDVAAKDRFKERAFPNQSDRPSEQTFQDLLDTVALADELTAVNNDVTALETWKTTVVDVQLPLKLTQATADTLYADIATEATVTTHTAQIAALQAFDATIPTNYYNKTQSDARFAPLTSTDNRLTALENDKLDTSVFEQYKDNVVNPRLNVEHITWNPKTTNETYLVPFLSNSKVNIKTLQFTNVPTWTIFAMQGNNILTGVKIESAVYAGNPTQVLANFNLSVNADPTITGFLIVAQTLQTVVNQTYTIPSAVTLRVEHQY